MGSSIKNALRLFMILLLLMGTDVLYAQQEIIQVQRLTDIYNDIKAGRLPLLEGKEIYIQSERAENTLKADVYAVTRNRFTDLSKALSTPENWCEFVPLHLNVKSCTCTEGSEPTVTFYAGRKFYEPPEDAYELRYRFQVTESAPDRFRVQLTAEKGPYGTSDYIIVLEAIPLEMEMLLHMCLSYKTSLISRSATFGYLSTMAKDKVGFTIAEKKAGEPVFIKGLNGIIERNVMRYFLALSVYMDTLNLELSNRFIQRAEMWYELTEHYATQLHELDKQEYMDAKQREHANQDLMQSQINLGSKQHGTDTIKD